MLWSLFVQKNNRFPNHDKRYKSSLISDGKSVNYIALRAGTVFSDVRLVQKSVDL